MVKDAYGDRFHPFAQSGKFEDSKLSEHEIFSEQVLTRCSYRKIGTGHCKQRLRGARFPHNVGRKSSVTWRWWVLIKLFT